VQSQSQRSCSAARSKRSLITKSPIRIGLNYSYFSAFPDRLSQHDNARKLLLSMAFMQKEPYRTFVVESSNGCTKAYSQLKRLSSM
jgi:hypothetical protein